MGSGGQCDRQARNHLGTVGMVTSSCPLFKQISPCFSCCSLGDNIVFTEALLQGCCHCGFLLCACIGGAMNVGVRLLDKRHALAGLLSFQHWCCIYCSLLCGTGVLLQTCDVVVNLETSLFAIVELAVRSQKHLFLPPCHCY